MTIEPTDRDLREIADLFNMDPAEFDKNQEWLTDFWNRSVSRTLQRYLYAVIRYEVHLMTALPPSSRHKYDWL